MMHPRHLLLALAKPTLLVATVVAAAAGAGCSTTAYVGRPAQQVVYEEAPAPYPVYVTRVVQPRYVVEHDTVIVHNRPATRVVAVRGEPDHVVVVNPRQRDTVIVEERGGRPTSGVRVRHDNNGNGYGHDTTVVVDNRGRGDDDHGNGNGYGHGNGNDDGHGHNGNGYGRGHRNGGG